MYEMVWVMHTDFETFPTNCQVALCVIYSAIKLLNST